jgi:excisionase family DNA binding protein
VAGTAEVQAQTPVVWPEVMNLEQAARYLKLDPQELRSMAERDLLPARRVGQVWRFNRDALLAWLTGEWGLVVAAVPPSGDAPLAPPSLAQITGAGAQAGPAHTDNGDRPDEEIPERIGEAPEGRSADEIFLRGQRVLLRPGDVVFDVGMFYTESDRQQFAPVDGGTVLADLESEVTTVFLLGRYGLFDETEIFFDTTYSSQNIDLRFVDETLSSTSRSEWGDVHLGLRHTLLKEAAGRPDVIITLDGRIPTDEDRSSYATGGGIALVKSIDPVVLFANAQYRHTFSQDFDDISRLEPENRSDVSLGYAFAINDTLSFNTTLSGVFTDESRFDSATLPRDELYTLQFGLTSWLAEGLYIEPTVGFSLNGPGDAFFIGLTLPYSFTP